METIISGSRRITDYGIVEHAINCSGFVITQVIEGGQRTWDKEHRVIIGGVDFFAAKWADKNGVPCKTFYANWKELGNAAGPIRNRKMAREGKQLIAIPDPESTGTVDMIDAAREAGFDQSHIFVYYDPDLFPEGPTGCLDDGDDLGVALKRLGREGVNRVLRDTLGTPNPLYVDDHGNG